MLLLALASGVGLVTPLSGAPPAPPVTLRVDAAAPTHELNPLHVGCHTDSGYVHQTRGFSSQMVIGESFEGDHYSLASWSTFSSAGATGSAVPDTALRFNGMQSERLSLTDAGPFGDGTFGLANRGLGGEGLFLEGGKSYEGYVFALAPAVDGPPAPVSLTVSLARRAAQADEPPLASVTLQARAWVERRRMGPQPIRRGHSAIRIAVASVGRRALLLSLSLSRGPAPWVRIRGTLGCGSRCDPSLSDLVSAGRAHLRCPRTECGTASNSS